MSKRKKTTLDSTPNSENVGLIDICTPSFSSNKSSIKVKKEKLN